MPSWPPIIAASASRFCSAWSWALPSVSSRARSAQAPMATSLAGDHAQDGRIDLRLALEGYRAASGVRRDRRVDRQSARTRQCRPSRRPDPAVVRDHRAHRGQHRPCHRPDRPAGRGPARHRARHGQGGFGRRLARFPERPGPPATAWPCPAAPRSPTAAPAPASRSTSCNCWSSRSRSASPRSRSATRRSPSSPSSARCSPSSVQSWAGSSA